MLSSPLFTIIGDFVVIKVVKIKRNEHRLIDLYDALRSRVSSTYSKSLFTFLKSPLLASLVVNYIHRPIITTLCYMFGSFIGVPSLHEDKLH